MYETSYRDAFASGYSQNKVKPVSDWVEDYHVLQSAKEEKYHLKFRQHLKDSGIPVKKYTKI